MDLKRWQYFNAVARVGSLAKAAQLLEIAPSALSRQIAILEEECGGMLFHRTGRGVVLTRLGEMVEPKARALLDQAERLAMEARESANVPTGIVKLGVLHSVGRPLVSELFEHLRQSAPGVHLHVIEAFSGLMDEYRNVGRIDLTVLNRYKRADIREEQLGRFDMHLVGPAGDPVTGARTIDFKSLDGLPFVLPGLPSELRIRLDQHARRLGITLDIKIEVETIVTMKDVCARSRLYTILPTYAVAEEVSRGELSVSRIVRPEIRRLLCLGVTSVRPMSLAMKEVTKALREISRRLMADGTWPTSIDQAR